MNDPDTSPHGEYGHREDVGSVATSVLSFNLVHEPWLPVTLLDGTTTTLGLSEFFARAHETRGLNEPSPLTYTAVMRYLLAILHRATDGPEDPLDWAERWRQDHFDRNEVDAYLGRWEDRFDLFHPLKPFAQAGPEIIFKSDDTISRLYIERTSGSNSVLFDHSWDAKPSGVSPAEACRALITAQAYAFSGAQIFANSAMIAGYSILLEGRNLFETLMLNLQEYSKTEPPGLTKGNDKDKPWWEQAENAVIGKAGSLPFGLTDFLTWRSRSIRLIPDEDGLIRRCFYAPGYKLRDDMGIRDPFKRYEKVSSGENKGQFSPKNFIQGKALWRDSFSLVEQYEQDSAGSEIDRLCPGIVSWLALAMNELTPAEQIIPVIIATGVINNKAKIDLWRMDRLPLPVSVLNNKTRRIAVRDAVGVAKDVGDALYRAGKSFASEALSLGERKPDSKDVARERASLKLDERYWSRLDAPFQHFMIDLANTDDVDAAVRSWESGINVIARSAFVEATTSAGLDSRWFRAQAFGARTLDSQLRKVLTEEIMSARETREEMKV